MHNTTYLLARIVYIINISQVALDFGANDFGSTMIEENVVAAAGITFRMTRQEIVNLIKDAGYIPAQRDTGYHILKIENQDGV